MNENGGKVERPVLKDKKTVKMFRRLERFLDQEALQGLGSVQLQNAETKRVFAVFVTPEFLERQNQYIQFLERTLQEAQERALDAEATVEILEDENLMLALIDAQNDLLQSLRSEDERGDAEPEVRIAFTADAIRD